MGKYNRKLLEKYVSLALSSAFDLQETLCSFSVRLCVCVTVHQSGSLPFYSNALVVVTLNIQSYYW